MKHVAMFSGGLGSWAAACRVAAEHGTDDLILLFCDTLMEDEDLYRFLPEAAANVGGELVRIFEGRDPWQVFFDERMLGNTRADPCSKILKRQLADRWLKENFDPEDTRVYVGIDWTEEHRFTGLAERKLPWVYVAPLCQAPFLSKQDMFDHLAETGIRRPRLYDMGFPHDNCGGFCVKAGQAHFANLLRVLPQRYAYNEGREQDFIKFIGKPVSILRDRTGGTTKPFTLKELRERIEAGGQIDMFEWGGCGCFSDIEEAQP